MFARNKEEKGILIIGGFNKAKSLSSSLIKKGYRVTVVNKNYDHCEKLAEIDKLRVIYGDGSKKFILEEAKAGDHQIAIALTPSDETNLVICEMCKKYFDVKKTVCLLNDPSKTDFYYKMGIDRVVCALNMITNIMEEQALMDEMTRRISVDEGRIHVLEIPVTKDSKIAGRKLWELNLPKEVIIGCILRNDQSLIPRGDSRINEGDILLIITSDEKKLREIKEFGDYAITK